METFDTIKRRVSVREYDPGPIEKGLLEKIVDAGRRAPTARRIEPWEFVVVTDKNTLAELGKICNTGTFIKDGSAAIVIFCKDTKYYLEDGCAATENILLAAADLGIGTCWIAGDKKPYTEDVSKLLKAPQGLKLISLISLGWPKNEKEQARARSLKEVIHWEVF